ncbi:MAG: DUF2974 domain-containing protein, partial [Alphaproteobacteria bacterium]|nr:DUF2974 domain-containing protein [Alphaproteobacteria bacterium]
DLVRPKLDKPNSLIAIRLIVRIQKTFGISFPIPNIYKYKTVEAMAKIIADDNSFSNEDIILPINKNGTEIPIFLIHPAPGFAFPYSILSKYLKNYPIYGINDASLNNPDLSFKTIQEMAGFYLKKIIEIQQNGPYILGGWSFGGAVALEIAYQLKAINQEVDAIIMFDSSFRPKEYYNEWTDQEIADDLHRIGLNHDSNEGKIIIEIMKRNGGLLKNYIPSNSRSQLLTWNKNEVILDAYNANPSSMKLAVENFAKMNKENKMVCLGGMRELGTDTLMEHQMLIDQLKQTNWKQVILVGLEFKPCIHNFLYFETVTEAKAWLHAQELKGYTLLIKGSRGIQMEQLIAP